MKLIILFLTLILFISCNSTLKERSNYDCSNVVVLEKMVMLSDYNKRFYDENYTGIVTSHYDNEKSKLEFILYYEDGEITKYETFYENGDPKLVQPIKCNSIHGNMIQYMDKGRKGYELEYKLGRKHGTGRSYYESGKVQKEIHFKNNLQDGNQYGFSENGDTILIEIYKNGVKIK